MYICFGTIALLVGIIESEGEMHLKREHVNISRNRIVRNVIYHLNLQLNWQMLLTDTFG